MVVKNYFCNFAYLSIGNEGFFNILNVKKNFNLLLSKTSNWAQRRPQEVPLGLGDVVNERFGDVRGILNYTRSLDTDPNVIFLDYSFVV